MNSGREHGFNTHQLGADPQGVGKGFCVRLLTEEVLCLMICSKDSSFGALARREGVASSTWYISLATSVSDNIVMVHLGGTALGNLFSQPEDNVQAAS